MRRTLTSCNCNLDWRTPVCDLHVPFKIPYVYDWFIHSLMVLQPFVGPRPLLQLLILFFTQSVRLLGGVSSPSQGRYLHTGQHKHRINAHANIHALSGIRTHDPSDQGSKDSSCLRPHGHCGRHVYNYITKPYGKQINVFPNHLNLNVL
jgi:hypothetical protein